MGDAPAPFQGGTLRRSLDGSEYIWRGRIASIADGHLDILVVLSRFPGGLPDEWELVFAVVKVEGEDVADYFDGRQTRGFLPDRRDRRQALLVALRGIDAVVDAASPRLLTFFTYSADLPRKALAKHLEVVATLEREGYRLISQSTMYGHESWTMERGDV